MIVYIYICSCTCMCVNAAKGYAVPAVKEYADQTGQNPSNMNFLVLLTGSRAFTVSVWNWSYGHYGHYGRYAHAWLGPLRCIDWAASCCRLQESVGSHENLMKLKILMWFSCDSHVSEAMVTVEASGQILRNRPNPSWRGGRHGRPTSSFKPAWRQVVMEEVCDAAD